MHNKVMHSTIAYSKCVISNPYNSNVICHTAWYYIDVTYAKHIGKNVWTV